MRKDFQAKIKTFLIVVLVAVVISVGGILLWKQSRQVAEQPTAQQTSPPAPSPQPKVIDTSGWQTYRNSEFGFEVKYPEDWEIFELQGREDYSNILAIYPVREPGEIAESSDPEISIAIVHRSFDEEKTKREKTGIKFNYSKTIIGQRNAYISIVVQGVEGDVKEVLIDARNDQAFIISTQNAIDVFDQILSTFRFVEE